ncbi:MAG: 16S rRNA (cytidine(1402)-2'-O)-methyltransferase [Oscillospiraceae bacterium]|jgi:16S rRNA (cytidine1402-2'-O)-methyltransferase|nr:16S rRNA (cytidine(1402)-2'-O)-methyltransferase [Oscillospiraceae bacterium]
MSGTLYVVATPIGNAEDISDRAKRILKEVDIIAAEDTRTTQKLLHYLGIKNKAVSNHKFNEKGQSEYFLEALLAGKSIAVVSDAGTPCISDPGAFLVSAAAAHELEVVGICGANAVITALSVSGFHFSSFAFYGFLPRTAQEIKQRLRSLPESERSVSVFFESPKRIAKTIQIIAEVLPEAQLCLCNDLTKFYEKIYRGAPLDVLERLLHNESHEKGEYTLVMQSFKAPEISADDPVSPEALLLDYMIKNSCSAKEAIYALTKLRKSIKKNEWYSASLRLRERAADLLQPNIKHEEEAAASHEKQE